MSRTDQRHDPAVARWLRVEWRWVAVAALLWAVCGAWLVGASTSRAAGDRWLVVAGVGFAYVVGFVGLHLGANRPPTEGGDLHASLWPANAVTVVRGGLYASVAGFVLVRPTGPVVWAPAMCYGLGAALDAVDGYLARRADRETVLGAKLDLAFDTFGFLVAPVVAVAWGRLPVWYLALSGARYCFRAGVLWRERRGRPVSDLPESRVRRPLAGLQMAFIAVALAPVLPTTITHPAAAVVVTPSLVVFGRDWLAVSGRL